VTLDSWLSGRKTYLDKYLRLLGMAFAALSFTLFVSSVLSAQVLPDAPSEVLAQQVQRGSKPDSALQSTQDSHQAQTGATSSGGDSQSRDNSAQSKDDSEGKQTKRMLWVVPNFAAVSANTQLPPLSPHAKFVLAAHDSFDYSSFVWTGIIAAQSFALNSDPELGHGIAGYGRYYWRAFADGVSGTFFTEAIVPTLTHEDPRYYTMGHGGFLHRATYALSRTFLTKTDSGGSSFNWSEVGGNGLEAALSNAYYPPQERGAGQTLRDWGTQMESAVLNNIAKEFWPDVRRDLFHRK
jgi:hypothetical protein